MKVIARTLAKVEHPVEVEEGKTVADLKDKVGEKLGYENPRNCTLISKGAILKNESMLSEANIVDGGFVVVMPPKAVKKAEKKVEFMLGQASEEPKGKPDEPVKVPAPVETPEQQPAVLEANPDNPLPSPAEYEATIKSICDMGFEEPSVRGAMRAAFNNKDRAVDYLLSGNFETTEQQTTTDDVQPNTPTSTRSTEPGTPPNTARPTQPAPAVASNEPFNMFQPQPRTPTEPPRGSPTDLNALSNQDALDLIKLAAQENMQLLGGLIPRLQESNPGLLQELSRNDCHDRLLEPIAPEQEARLRGLLVRIIESALTDQVGEMSERPGMGESAPPPGAHTVQLNQEEQAQIERLKSQFTPFGIQTHHILEAFLVCRRNEEEAANYLQNNCFELLEDAEEPPAEDTGNS
ncbi:hypothetical protein NDN08_000704 [Rhodosorus marinus]|uniref:UV excision repair protein RAD23 n=1 Tax=Rhodosorus marinus TaxID=101924 RepID=A0AAV8USV9_9RHOD|nr:hypothetical protein NDN08_000704 [Rhodosorus marinus]